MVLLSTALQISGKGHDMRTKRLVSLDLAAVERARQVAGLGDEVPDTAVIRYAVAVLAGLPTAEALDSTGGKGSLTYRARLAAEQAAGGRAA